MRNVTFQTEPALYDSFTILCKLEKKQLGEKISELIQDYLKNNEEKTKFMGDTPKISRRPPEFFTPKSTDWTIFCDSVDSELLIKTYNRALFIEKLAENQKQERIMRGEGKQFQNLEKFEDTRDAKDLKRRESGHTF